MPNPGRPYPFHPDLPPDEPDKPTPDAATADTPQQPPVEPNSTPESRLLAGRFKSLEDLETAYNNSYSELARIREENSRQLEAERRRVDALIAQRETRQQPDPLDELQTYGVPPNLIRDEIDRRASRIARETVEQALSPMKSAGQARSSVARKFQDFSQREQEIADFVGADPSLTERYSRLFETDPAAAMEWAYLIHRDSHPAQKPQRRTAAEDPTAGALPATSGGGGERTPVPAQQAERDELAKAREYYKVYKDPMPYVRARMRGLIPDSHFTQG